MKIDAIASPRGSNDNSPSPRSGCGVARVSMMYSPENLRVQRIIRKVHPNVAFSGDQIECEIALAPPDALSIAAELCDDGCALALSLWDWQGRLAPAA